MAGRPQPKTRYWKNGHDPKLRRLRVPTTSDIAWAAGIYEGEGSVYGSQIHISQKDPWILNRLRLLFGGTVSGRRKAKTTPAGEYFIYRWYCQGARARGFALTIFTFLSPRRRAQFRTHVLASG